eukprot:755922-Hanusia_phi.AAC.1
MQRSRSEHADGAAVRHESVDSPQRGRYGPQIRRAPCHDHRVLHRALRPARDPLIVEESTAR